MRKSFVFLCATSLLLSGCGKSIRDFVMDGNPVIPDVPLPASAPSSRAVKVSPGSGVLAGSAVRAQATVTPTQTTAAGTQVRAKLSLSQSRME